MFRQIFSLIVAVFFIAAFPIVTLAAQITVEADGYYTIGDGPDENLSVAKERAKVDALRNASEKAAVFVESLTVVKNGQLSTDEVRALSANVMRLQEEPKFKIIPVSDDVISYQCHLIAVVDTDNINDTLLYNKQAMLEATQRNIELQQEIARLNEEMATLKKQYTVATDDTERQRLRALAQQNGNNFTAAQLNNEGANAYDAGRFDVAAKLFTKAIELNGSYEKAYYNRGNAYAKLGHYEEALRDYDTALRINPKFAAAKENRATITALMKGE